MAAHLLLSGTTGGFARAPDLAAYDTAGSIDIRADVEPDVVNITQYVLSRFQTDFLWRVALSSTTFIGRFEDSLSTTENVSMSSTITAARWQVRWVLDFGASEARAYMRDNSGGGTALSSDTGWNAVNGSPDAITITDLKQGVDPITIGASGSTGISAFDGKIYRVQLYHGTDAGGTLVFDADPSDETTWAGDELSFTEKANSQTVTLNGDAVLVADPLAQTVPVHYVGRV